MDKKIFKENLKQMNENNQKLWKEFHDYLIRAKPIVNKCLEEHKNEFHFFVWFLWEMELYISFVFDEKIVIKDYFAEDIALIIHRIFWEISGLIWWVRKCLEGWTIIWAFGLLRMILERIIILKVFFEDFKQIEKRIEKYNIFGNIESYKQYEKCWWNGLNKDFINEITNDYNTYESQFRKDRNNHRKHSYFQWIYNRKITITELLDKFWLDIENTMYPILSHVSHGWPLNINLLNTENGLFPNKDSEKYMLVIKLIVSLLGKSYEDFCKYTKKEDLRNFFQIMFINMDDLEKKMK